MKTLKNYLPAFLFVLALFFMPSCSQDEIQEAVVPEVENLAHDNLSDQKFILPLGYAQKSEEEVNNYLKTLEEDALVEKLVEHTRIAFYLNDIGMREKVEKTLKTGDLYSAADLNTLLSADQLKKMKSYQMALPEESTRWCSNWQYIGRTSVCLWYAGVICVPHCRYDFTKTCNYWPYSYYKYNYVDTGGYGCR